MIHHQDDHLTVHIGDCREVLAGLPAESVHCVVTSPPYWGLRDYGTASWAGGDADCDHKGPPLASDKSGLAGYTSENIKLRTNGTPYRTTCGKCGAARIDSQLGLEPTPEAFIAAMVDVFREVKRVLRNDGTLWLNMGDSFADKQLAGMPWRLAFALQADGWYLRSDIIWSKPNPMPESVTDRPTKSHEYVFLLTKSARYYYDAEAVREPHQDALRPNGPDGIPVPPSARYGLNSPAHQSTSGDGLQRPTISTKTWAYHPAGRNLRSVWQIATEPYPGAHFATFPQKLVEPCIKAGTSERGVCPECGAPWVREVEVELVPTKKASNTFIVDGRDYGADRNDQGSNRTKDGHKSGYINSVTTTGWKPFCACCSRHPSGLCVCEPRPTAPDPIPATVLDPFAGSGTTGLVANRLGRRAILIDLSADYIDQAMLRNQQHPLGLIG